jgi:hypothetical protein
LQAFDDWSGVPILLFSLALKQLDFCTAKKLSIRTEGMTQVVSARSWVQIPVLTKQSI